jgi:hypothetical protein
MTGACDLSLRTARNEDFGNAALAFLRNEKPELRGR